MQIQREEDEQNTIQAYDNASVKINGQIYTHSFILSKHQRMDWSVRKLEELNQATIQPILKWQPKLIIIGHTSTLVSAPVELMSYLSQQQVGIEVMNIGAACRTYNLLVNEGREVVLGLVM